MNSNIIDFQNKKIEELTKDNAILFNRNLQLATWILEVCDEDCPKEYKEAVAENVSRNY